MKDFLSNSYVQSLALGVFKQICPFVGYQHSNRNICIYNAIAKGTPNLLSHKSWFTSLSSPKRYTGNKASEISIFYAWHKLLFVLGE